MIPEILQRVVICRFDVTSNIRRNADDVFDAMATRVDKQPVLGRVANAGSIFTRPLASTAGLIRAWDKIDDNDGRTMVALRRQGVPFSEAVRYIYGGNLGAPNADYRPDVLRRLRAKGKLTPEQSRRATD